MSRGFYNFFRIPYYWVHVTSDGQSIFNKCIRISKQKKRWFKVKKMKSAFILPDISYIPTLKWKMGTILVYDEKNAYPLEALPENLIKEITSDDTSLLNRIFSYKTKNAINANYWVKSAIDPEKLHEFFEAEVTRDILSGEKAELPMWLLLLIGLGITAVMVMFAIYSFTKTGDVTPIINQTVTPLPTSGVVVIP